LIINNSISILNLCTHVYVLINQGINISQFVWLRPFKNKSKRISHVLLLCFHSLFVVKFSASSKTIALVILYCSSHMLVNSLVLTHSMDSPSSSYKMNRPIRSDGKCGMVGQGWQTDIAKSY
jgi:hypothetical protein